MQVNYENLIVSSLSNVVNDLEKIGFPYIDSITIYPIVFLITLTSSIFTIIFVDFEYYKKSIEIWLLQFVYIFLINSGVLTFYLYLLRLFNLSRFVIVGTIIIYPFIFTFLYGIYSFALENKISKSFLRYGIGILLVSLLGIFISSYNFNTVELSISQPQVQESNNNSTSSNEQSSAQELICNPWAGSENFTSCLYGVEIEVKKIFNEQVNNMTIHNDLIYFVQESGKVYTYTDNRIELFLDISEKVFFKDGGEEGTFDMEFHPNGDYFLISYSDNQVALVVEKYFIENNKPNTTNSEILIEIPNNQCCHFSGSLLWSSFFEGFLLSVGDMEANNVSILNSEPLNTTSPRGKLLLLDSNKNFNSPKINSIKNYEPLENIVGYGLRNPWQVIEYKNKLIIPDVGSSTIEELNILDLTIESPFQNSLSFGWPIFEGPELSKELNPKKGGDLAFEETNITELFIWNGDKSEKADEYIISNSVKPSVYYYHQPGDYVYRAALIGGDVIDDTESYFYEYYFFTDYITKELFSYDLNEDKLYIFPLENKYESNPTALRIHPDKKDTIILSLRSGEFVEILLPKTPQLNP